MKKNYYNNKNNFQIPTLKFSQSYNLDQQFYQIQQGQVIDIVINKSHPQYSNQQDLFKIKIKLIGQSPDSKNYQWAYPINSFMVILPLKNQIVHCYKLISQNSGSGYINNYDQKYYYVNPINMYNKINNKLYNISNHNIDYNQNYEDLFDDSYLVERNLLIGQGDNFIQGRLGQFLQFTSKQLKCKNPIVKLGIDNNNYILIGNNILSQISSNINNSYLQNIDTQNFMCNVQKIILNSTIDDIIVSSNKDIVLSSNNAINISNKLLNLEIEEVLTINANKQILINSNKIIFNNGDQPIVNGNSLIQILSQILDQISRIIVITPVGNSSTPVNNLRFQMLKNKLNSCLNKNIFI